MSEQPRLVPMYECPVPGCSGQTVAELLPCRRCRRIFGGYIRPQK